ncbi:hypothetical protein M1567_02490 [Candidatus Marsarchaeota archaeon]|nr:hypothetical protein [Candidatus Marsarchaeota archaeon]
MEKNKKNFPKAEFDSHPVENTEKQRLELVSKLSGAVLYNLLRVKDQKTIHAAQSLKGALNCYANTYSNIEKLTYAAGKAMDYRLAIDYIRDELGLKTPGIDPYSVCIDESSLSKSIKGELSEHSWSIAKVLLEVSRKAYGKMGEKETIFAANKIISATEQQSDITNFSYVVEKVLSATEELGSNLADFVNEYAYLKACIKEISIRSITQKSVGEGHEAILRTASAITSEHIAKEDVPSWPKITIERSISGKDVGMAMHFAKSSSYFAIVYLKPRDYNLIASFVIQLKETIKELESVINPKESVPSLSIKTYSDIGICMVGSAHFDPKSETAVRDNLQKLFGRK